MANHPEGTRSRTSMHQPPPQRDDNTRRTATTNSKEKRATSSPSTFRSKKCDDDDDDDASRRAGSLPRLPEALVGRVLEYLPLRDERAALATCRELYRNVRPALDARRRSLRIDDARDHAVAVSASPPTLPRFVGLLAIDAGRFGTDDLLRLLGAGASPSLRSLSVRRSTDVTDGGLASLAAAGADRLVEIDLVFCPRVAYAGLAPLRRPSRTLRRLPAWLTGSVRTPFRSDDDPSSDVEVHRYWPDGTFSFSREAQSNGHVCELVEIDENDEDFVSDKLQYNDFDPPPGWPAHFRYCYRPGVSLLRLREEENDNNGRRVVLVGQSLRGLRPPTDRRLFETARRYATRVGESRYLTADGTPLVGTPASWRRPPRGAAVLMSRMEVLPFDEKERSTTTTTPPPDLVERCTAACRERARNVPDDVLEMGEELLHAHFSTA